MNEIDESIIKKNSSYKMAIIKGIKVGQTNINSEYTDGQKRSDSELFTVVAVSLGSISSIDNSTYMGTDITPLPIITAVVNGETVELQNGIDYTLSYSNNKNVGIATVTATGIGNFTGTVSTTWNIVPKIATLSWGQTTWMFDGSAHTVTCTVSNLETGDTCIVTLDNPTRTAIGTQTVEAIGLSNSNYTLTGATDLTRDLIISAALFVKLSGTWTPVKGVYKKIGGSWIEQDMTSAFSTSERYKKMN